MHFKVDAADGKPEVIHLRAGFGAVPLGDATPSDPSENDLQLIVDNFDVEFDLNPQ